MEPTMEPSEISKDDMDDVPLAETLKSARKTADDASGVAAPPSDVANDEEAAGLMSDVVKAELVDWQKIARPTETVLVVLTLLLTIIALNGSDWIFGANSSLKMVRAGLYSASEESMSSGPLWHAGVCASAADSVACALATAGGSTSSFVIAAFIFAFLLAAFFVTDELARRGLLDQAQAKIPPALPLARIAALVPPVLWSLLAMSCFVALLVFALMAPSTLGGGLAHLGSSYGAVRLALLVALGGLTVHLSLIQRLGEDQMVALLDALYGHWKHLTRRQKATQLLLGMALLSDMLLWVRRVEWGGLVPVYGLWAYVHHDHDHLGIFCCVASFSMCTDALALASDIEGGVLLPLLTWPLLLSKLGAVSLLVYYRDAFA